MIFLVTRYRTRTVALAALVAAACSNGVGPQVESRTTAPGFAETSLSNGLVHRVSMPRSPQSGTDVTIRSVIVNTSAMTMIIEHRECALDYRGTLKLSGPPHVLKCQAFSRRRTIAPGDSIVGADYMRIASGSGRYDLLVRHALEPETWTPIEVLVR